MKNVRDISKWNTVTNYASVVKESDGVIVRIKTDIVERDLLRIKNKEDILDFMKKYIRYGWRDVNGNFHINTMKEFRRIYRTGSIQDTLKYGIGTCVEQVAFMKYLADKINLKAKMFVQEFMKKKILMIWMQKNVCIVLS